MVFFYLRIHRIFSRLQGCSFEWRLVYLWCHFATTCFEAKLVLADSRRQWWRVPKRLLTKPTLPTCSKGDNDDEHDALAVLARTLSVGLARDKWVTLPQFYIIN